METANANRPIVEFVEPSREEWVRLYDAATRFHDLAPWRWMEEIDLFGVTNPETGEVGYACIMGMAGEHFSLALYLGTAGLQGFWDMRRMSTSGLPPDAGEFVHVQDNIMLSYEDRDYLDKRDHATVKSLGLKFRGPMAWPQFRRYKPDFMPWHIESHEARFLTFALEQALDVAPRFRADPTLLTRATRTGPYLLRVSTPSDDDGDVVWRDVIRKPVALPKSQLLGRPVKPLADLAERARTMAQSLPQVSATLDVDYVFLMRGIQGDASTGGRPTMPNVALFMDDQSGAAIDTTILSPDTMERDLPKMLLDVLSKLGGTGLRPGLLCVKRDRTFAILKPYADLLDVPIEQRAHIQAVQEMQQGLAGMN